MNIYSIDSQPSVSINTQNIEQTSKVLEQYLKERRMKVFFNPVILQNTRINNDDISSNASIRNNSFFNNVSNADYTELKKIFNTELNNFIKITKYFCQDRQLLVLKKLISRIKNEPTQDNTDYLKNNFSNCIYQIHDLIILLENFKYQLEQQNAVSADIAISKDAIALRLDECMINLDSCWAGIYNKLSNLYEILSSLNQGIEGEIHIIKKELFNTIISDYLTKKKHESQHLFLDSNEIHIHNSLYNLMHEVLGMHKIEDSLEDKSLPDAIKNEFIELIKIEISPAKITSILANKIYQQFTAALTDISMDSWLTEYKINKDLIHKIKTLDTKFFVPINTLFNAAEADKLCISSLIDTKKEEPRNNYLNYSKEKIHQWIAIRLMPNSKKILTTIDNLTLNSIDYMFFWGYNEGDHDFDNDDSNDYIRLQLSHIQNLDFIDFTDVDLENHSCLSDNIKKTAVSIALVTQAMEQTNNIEGIIDFFTDINVHNKLNNLPILKNKLYNILNDKLIDINFRKQFSNAIIKLITIKNYDLNIDEIYFLVNNCICVDVLVAMIEQNLCIDNLMTNINIKYFNDITIKTVNMLADTTKELLFSRAFNDNSCELIYKLLTVSGSNKYNNIASNETIFALAIKYNHPKLVELLLQDTNSNIKDYNLFSSFYDGNDKIIYLCIKHILSNKNNFPIDSFINNIQARNENDCPGLFVAFQNGHYKIVNEYINLILASEELTKEQKIKLIQAKTNYGFSGFCMTLCNGHDKTVNEYINLILASDKFTTEQKFNLIQAKDKDGFPSLLIAVESGHDKTVKEYINLISTSNIFDIKQKRQLIQIDNKLVTSSLFIALKNGHKKTFREYITDILNANQLELKYKKILINAIIEKSSSLCNVLITNSNLTHNEKRYLVDQSSNCVVS
jgi:hypothetical protein